MGIGFSFRTRGGMILPVEKFRRFPKNFGPRKNFANFSPKSDHQPEKPETGYWNAVSPKLVVMIVSSPSPPSGLDISGINFYI
jgi:hypothetical protein